MKLVSSISRNELSFGRFLISVVGGCGHYKAVLLLRLESTSRSRFGFVAAVVRCLIVSLDHHVVISVIRHSACTV